MTSSVRAKSDFFLKHSELPKGLGLCWGIINARFELVKISEVLYERVKKPITAILKQPLINTLVSFPIKDVDLSNRLTEQLVHFIDDKGRAVQASIFPIEESDEHWSIFLTEVSLDEQWLMELHPDYNQAIQSSDDWLTQIEEVINAKSDVVFRTSIKQGLSLTLSTVGYLHTYDDKKKQIIKTSWTEEVGYFFQIPENQKYSANSGVWAEVFATGESVIHNEPIIPPENKSQADGYFPFKNHMCIPINYRGKLVGVIGVGNRDKPYTKIDAKSLSVFATILWHSVELPRTMKAVSKQSSIIKAQKEKMTQILVQLIGAISEALELKDAYTAGHQKSVAQLSYLMGEKMGLSPDVLEGLKLGALIHDIGKLAIPSQILSKPSRLTDAEFGMVKQHPIQGAMIVDEVEFPWPIKQMILQHHERLDGSGYPNGLKDKDIILEARIIAVADIADSILSHRPYRPSLGNDVLTKILLEGRGKTYDAAVVDACLDILSIHEIKKVEHVGSLDLEPVVILEEYHTLEHAEEMLKKVKTKVAVIISETTRKPIGLIDRNILNTWRSPFLDTAAERAADRTLLNKRVHQIMEHKFDAISYNMILKDAKAVMEKSNLEYLVVQAEDGHIFGVVTWRILTNGILKEIENERMG